MLTREEGVEGVEGARVREGRGWRVDVDMEGGGGGDGGS